MQTRTTLWNATYSDYSAHALPEGDDIKNQHYTSSSDGRLITVDPVSGEILWEVDVGSPIVGLYTVHEEGMFKVRSTVLGKDTLDTLLLNASAQTNATRSIHKKETTLFPTLFIGEFTHGLYALSSLVDGKTTTIVSRHAEVPLLDGPSPIRNVELDSKKGRNENRPKINWDPELVKLIADGEVLILGHHEMPSLKPTQLILTRTPTRPMPYRMIEYEKSLGGLAVPSTRMNFTTIVAITTTLVVILFGSGVTIMLHRKRLSSKTSSQNVQTSNRNLIMYHALNEIPADHFRVGNISYNPKDLLGHGCDGTVVYRGTFDGRDVAVKRVVSDFFTVADTEVAHLRESDEHPNVIRYFCMEADSQFRYIALELCAATLQNFVESPDLQQETQLEHIDILHQASTGLAHLHKLNIVHRDVKPQNVLLTSNNGKWRVVISDFGLCKKMPHGRFSMSQRSGSAGTDGWIAPEVLKASARVSYKADVFSLGCVFYYVLTGGQHPFGEQLTRQANICRGICNLQALTAYLTDMTFLLIEQMLRGSPVLRPPSSFLLSYPLFWTKAKQLAFFQDVSDRIEKEDQQSDIVRSLERGGHLVVTKNWRDVICPALQEDLRKFRTYRHGSVRDLLRAMRNKKNHYRELPPAVQQSLGSVPDQFVAYFTDRFPKLLLHVWLALDKHVSEEPVFHSYYHEEYRLSDHLENDV